MAVGPADAERNTLLGALASLAQADPSFSTEWLQSGSRCANVCQLSTPVCIRPNLGERLLSRQVELALPEEEMVLRLAQPTTIGLM